MNSSAKDILDYLRTLIKKHPELNQKVIAGRLGCSTSQVSQVLRGDRKASIDFIIKISDAIGVTLQDVIAATNPGSSAKLTLLHQPEIFEGVKNIGNVEGFRNKRLAKTISEQLLVLESINPAELIEVKEYIQFKLMKCDRRKSDQPDKIPETGDRRKNAMW